MIVHATLLAAYLADGWQGVLVRGPSGAGKSDLALCAILQGWRLVADDRVVLWRSGGAVYGCAPPALAGLLETRGLGVLAEPALRFAPVRLVVEACEAPERIPDPARTELLGLHLAGLGLPLKEAASLAKLGRALSLAVRGRL